MIIKNEPVSAPRGTCYYEKANTIGKNVTNAIHHYLAPLSQFFQELEKPKQAVILDNDKVIEIRCENPIPYAGITRILYTSLLGLTYLTGIIPAIVGTLAYLWDIVDPINRLSCQFTTETAMQMRANDALVRHFRSF